MKVALVHDWLTGMRGGERCLEVFCRLFPDADLYSLLHVPGRMSPTIEAMKIHTSFINRLPAVATKYRSYLPLFPRAIESLDLVGYDLILSSSHCVAKSAPRIKPTRHLCYCFTPMRYVWEMYDQYFAPGRSGAAKRIAMKWLRPRLQRWDVQTAGRVDRFVAISATVAARIERHYHQPAEVIYPPVDCSHYTPGDQDDEYYLILSAFAPYKRIDLAIEAFNRLKRPLKIVGSGQDADKLKAAAGSHVEFLGSKTDAEVADLYRRCRALIFPGEEDFGITPLEAMASGRPVIAYGAGGVTETVVPFNRRNRMVESTTTVSEPTGVFFYEQTPEALTEAVELFEREGGGFDKTALRNRALQFDLPRFETQIRQTIQTFMGT